MRRMFFSIPALALACATSSPSPQISEIRKAQSDAQQQYQDATSAQKHATEEQQKAEQAERDVTAAQKTLADAQTRLAGQRAKAAQAQRDASQLARDAQVRGAKMQDDATQLQGQQTQQGQRMQQENQRAWMQTQNIHGSIAAVSPRSLTIRSDDRADVLLQIGDSTAVNLDGRTASMAEIRAGSDVRASYGVVDGQSTAMWLDVTSIRSDSAPSGAK